MILLIESGGTKADVALINDQLAVQYTTMSGFNPTISHGQDLYQSIQSTPLIFDNLSSIKKVVYYGAGMAKPANIQLVNQLLVEIFPLSEIELMEDLVGAIRASEMIDQQDRIVCILGTGCNLAIIKNKEVHHAGVSLGFILGDEGSGAYLGKQFLTQVLRGQFDEQITQEVLSQLNCKTKEEVVTTLYKHPKPNQFLGSLGPILKKYSSNKQISKLIDSSFQDFVDYKLSHFQSDQALPIYFIGSIATYFKEQLTQVLARNGFHYAETIEKPIERLVEFELNRITPPS